MESIMQEKKECYFCHTTQNLECHHCISGIGRSASEKYGLKVWICADHHTQSPHSVHRDNAMLQLLKKQAQKKFEETHTRQEFIKEFGKSFL